LGIDVQTVLFEFIGGLGIFLLGIKYMGDGLQQSAGDRLRDILDKFTSNPFLGVLAGIIVTILIQSSSGTTVLTVGLVNAGFMTFRQAIGVIMGANIGTTVTAFIIGLDIGEYALPIIAIGCFLIFFFKNQKVTAIGQTIFGFGALFFGLELMSSGMSPLRSLEAFHELTVSMSENSILGVVIGTVFTLIVQSSSATIGILQGLYSEGAIDLKAAIPVLMGDNIGTTITAVLAAIGASVAAKRAAFTHVFFNLIGATIFIIILGLFTSFVTFLQSYFNLDPEMTLAFAHGSFNITNTIIQFPFIGALAWLGTKLIPGEDTIIEYKPQHLDPIFIQQSSTLALDQAKAEIIRMGEYAYKGLEETNSYLITQQQKHAEMATQVEGALNNLERDKHTAIMDRIAYVYRISEHIEYIIEQIVYNNKNTVIITYHTQEELKNMYYLTILIVKQAVKSLEQVDRQEAIAAIQQE